MSNGKVNNWADVQSLLTSNEGSIAGAPHGEFWVNLTYAQFVDGCVPDPAGVAGGPPCVTDASGNPVQILIKGNSKQSNIILALSGLPPFDGSVFKQMPDGSPPFAPDQIAALAAWIDAGCPE